MNEIERIRYYITLFDFDLMAYGAREIIDIYPDGHTEIKKYPVGSRRLESKKSINFPSDEYPELCESINECILNADSLNDYVDNSDAMLYLYHKYGREEKLPRGLGNDVLRIADIMSMFLSKYEIK